MNVLVTGGAWNYVIMVVPQLTADLGLERADFLTLWSGISLGALLASIPAGALGDRFGVRRVIGAGLAIAGGALLLRSTVGGFASMFLAMICFGLALAIVMSNFPKAIAVWFPVSELGLANGLAQAGVGLGLGAAAFATPFLLEAMGGWRGLTRVFAYVSFAVAVMWVASVRDPEAVAAEDTEPGAGAGGLAALWRPIASVLRVRDIGVLSACYMLYVGGYLGAIGYLPTYLGSDQGMSAGAVGMVVSLGPWSFMLGSMLLPTLSDRIGLRRRVFGPGMFVAGLAVFGAAYALGAPLVVCFIVWGFSSGVVGILFVIPVELDEVGQSLAGSAVGAMTMAGFLGGFLSPVVGMALVRISPALGFGFWTLCFAASALLVLAVRETGPRARDAA
jgi:NNP family nitrate/nitrite transporter-like MFS transporter